MNKLVLFSVLFFCYVGSVWTNGNTTVVQPSTTGDPNAYPVPSPGAKLCMQALNRSGILDKCHNQALNMWNPAKRGESVSSILDFCCSIYEETDCLINATTNGNYCTNDNGEQEAAINHQRTVFGWWKRNDCQSVSYHTGQCDADQKVFPPPQPRLVADCNKKIYNKVNHCEDKAKSDWNVKPSDTFFSQSVCCSKYQINDCFVKAAQEICSKEELTQYHLYYYNLDMNISSINCTNYQYQSIGCLSKNSAFPPIQPPLALSCTGKIDKEMTQCADSVAYQWKIDMKKDIGKMIQNGKGQCCAVWDFIDCVGKVAKDKCTLRELSQFEQYFNVLSQQIINVNCTLFPYHSNQCKGQNPSPQREVVSCLSKINSDSCEKQFKGKKWYVKGDNSSASDSTLCCTQLHVDKCLESSAIDKCTAKELVLFHKYLSDNTAAQCGSGGFDLDQCSNGSGSVGRMWMTLMVMSITWFFVLIYCLI